MVFATGIDSCPAALADTAPAENGRSEHLPVPVRQLCSAAAADEVPRVADRLAADVVPAVPGLCCFADADARLLGIAFRWWGRQSRRGADVRHVSQHGCGDRRCHRPGSCQGGRSGTAQSAAIQRQARRPRDADSGRRASRTVVAEVPGVDRRDLQRDRQPRNRSISRQSLCGLFPVVFRRQRRTVQVPGTGRLPLHRPAAERLGGVPGWRERGEGAREHRVAAGQRRQRSAPEQQGRDRRRADSGPGDCRPAGDPAGACPQSLAHQEHLQRLCRDDQHQRAAGRSADNGRGGR